MAIKRIKEVVPGMVLNAAVHDKSGRLLLGKGVTISQKHMMVFMTWGVSEVDADLPETDSGGAEAAKGDKAESKTKIPPKVEELFSHVDRSHPLMEELFLYCCQNPPREGR
ncbi:MAG: hypothetical protein HQL69_05295 [Magnetococcales bacterium]|nr:hypothetical protein [Magnetococcales bacterium]